MERKKRKPLVDITNTYNLIPTSTLRDLVAATSNPNLRSKPPTSILKSASSSAGQNLLSESLKRSGGSIGSLNVNSADSKTVQVRNPPRAVSSTTGLGGPGIKGVAYNRKQTTEKDRIEETDILIVSPTHGEKREGKEKAIAVAFSSAPETEADAQIFGSRSIEKRKDKGKSIAEPFGSSVSESEADGLIFGSTVERRKDKGKAIGVSFSSAPYGCETDVETSSPTSVEKRKDKGKVVSIPYNSFTPESEAGILNFGQTSVERRKDKGKAIDVPFSLSTYKSKADAQTSTPTPIEMGKDKGKAIAVPFCSSKRGREADVLVPGPSHLERRKDKGKAIAVPFRSLASISEDDILIFGPPTEKRKDKGKASSSTHETEANAQTYTPIPSKKRKDKGKVSAVAFNSSRLETEADVLVSSSSPVEKRKDNGGYVEIMEDSGKKILNTYSRPFEKAEKGKGVLNPSISSIGAQVIEKAITNHSSCSKKRRNDEYEGVARPSVSSITKTKETGKESIIRSAERAKENEKHLSLFSSLLKKTRCRGKVILEPSDIVEIAKHKESSGGLTVSRQPPRRKSGKGKNDVGASSCPPIRRTKNLLNDLDEAGDVKSSNSWTEPRPNSRKRRRPKGEPTHELPQDFVEQQKAYFKEVDEFELPEEEVSQDDLE